MIVYTLERFQQTLSAGSDGFACSELRGYFQCNHRIIVAFAPFTDGCEVSPSFPGGIKFNERWMPVLLIKSPGLPILAKHMPILGQQRLGNVAACQRISQWLKTCFYAATPSLAGIGRTAMRGKSVKQQHIAWMGREDILAAQHIRAHLPPGWIDLQLKWQQCLARFFPYPQVLRRWVECRRMKLYSPHNREVIQA